MNDNTVSPVLKFPLPAMAGGGNATLEPRKSARAGHVDLVLKSAFLNSVVTLPAFEVFGFVEKLGELCVEAMPPHD